MGAIDFSCRPLSLFQPGESVNGARRRRLALGAAMFSSLSFYWFVSSGIFMNCFRQIFSKMSVAPADLRQEEGKSVANDLPRGVNTAGSYRKVCFTPPTPPGLSRHSGQFPFSSKEKAESLE